MVISGSTLRLLSSQLTTVARVAHVQRCFIYRQIRLKIAKANYIMSPIGLQDEGTKVIAAID
jgi:hypothetical protein